MATRTDCLPWWHAKFAPLQQETQVYLRSGCSLGGNGNINCEPEAMRATAEATLRAAGWSGSLSLEAYTLARYMQGEVGSGTLEERVAVGEAAVNRARRERLTGGVLGLLLYRQAPGHPNRGYYGPIHGPGGTSTAPYGRWATTSADPTILTTLLAEFVINGHSENFANDADDQDGPEYWISQGQGALNNYIQRLANSGKYWVGPLPNIDHWHTFLQFTPGIPANTPVGQQLMQRGLEALQLPRQPAPWPSDMPVCSRPMGRWYIAALIGFAIGSWWFARRHSTKAISA